MRRIRFLVSSLLAAGFSAHQDALAAALNRATGGTDDPDRRTLLEVYTQDHTVTLAQHRSHSSHSSHRSGYGGGGGSGHYSHTSHRSSSGGGYYPSYQPAPVYVPPIRSAPTPDPTPTTTHQPLFAPETRAPAPPSDGRPALSGRTQRFKSIVRRVQIALLARDMYSGAIDGVVGPSLRAALRRLQKERGLEVTGTITPSTLDALMVSSE